MKKINELEEQAPKMKALDRINGNIAEKNLSKIISIEKRYVAYSCFYFLVEFLFKTKLLYFHYQSLLI